MSWPMGAWPSTRVTRSLSSRLSISVLLLCVRRKRRQRFLDVAGVDDLLWFQGWLLTASRCLIVDVGLDGIRVGSRIGLIFMSEVGLVACLQQLVVAGLHPLVDQLLGG